MSEQFTPGPWRIVDEGDECCVVRGSHDDAFVAGCADGFYNDDGDYVRAATVDANARLIAASPELYEALAAVDKWLIEAQADRVEAPYELETQIRAALAKVQL